MSTGCQIEVEEVAAWAPSGAGTPAFGLEVAAKEGRIVTASATELSKRRVIERAAHVFPNESPRRFIQVNTP